MNESNKPGIILWFLIIVLFGSLYAGTKDEIFAWFSFIWIGFGVFACLCYRHEEQQDII